MAENYTTTRNIRELQLIPRTRPSAPDYTTTRNIRELQLPAQECSGAHGLYHNKKH